MRLQKLIYQGIVWRGLYYASVFVLNIVIARVFQAADSGWINYLINNLSFLILVISLSLESALGYFASKNEISLQKLTGFSSVFSIVSSLVGTGMIALYLLATEDGYDPASNLTMAFMYLLGFVLTNYFSSLFYAAQKPVTPNAIMLVINLAVIAFGWSYMGEEKTYPSRNIPVLFAYFFSFPLQGILIALVWGYSNNLLTLRLPDKNEMKKMFRYAFAALLANVIFFLVYRVDYWFVEAFSDEKSLGNYIQVSKLGQIFLLLPSIIATAIFTRTAGGNQEHTRNVIEIISRWLLVFYIVFVMMILITGRWLFPWVYGASFDQMYAPFMLLAPGIVSLSTLSLLTAFYAGRNKLNINITGSVIALVIIVAGDFLFIPRYGIVAAALVSSIGYICFTVYVLYRFRKEYRSNLLEFFIPKWSDWDKVKQYIRAEAN